MFFDCQSQSGDCEVTVEVLTGLKDSPQLKMEKCTNS